MRVWQFWERRGSQQGAVGSCGELWFRKVRPQVGGIGVGSPESMAILPLQFLAFLPFWLLGFMILCQVESFSKKSLPGN